MQVFLYFLFIYICCKRKEERSEFLGFSAIDYFRLFKPQGYRTVLSTRNNKIFRQKNKLPGKKRRKKLLKKKKLH